MEQITKKDLENLYIPPKESHKGQNGRLLIIGGSHLFHAASLWALEVASRIVDLVHYSSIDENNALVQSIKSEFRNGMVIPRADIESYIEEDDCILIGPGMVRIGNSNLKSQISKSQLKIQNLKELESIKDEGVQTQALTNYLLAKYPKKQWVIDAGALQMMDVSLIPQKSILTPHHMEFNHLLSLNSESGIINNDENYTVQEKVKNFATKYKCTVLLKGQKDIACDEKGECREVAGGNAGMTKGGTGDVLAGLIAALACKNDPYLATIAGSFINKAAGDELYKTVGPFFNATDLAKEIPVTMNKLFIA